MHDRSCMSAHRGAEQAARHDQKNACEYSCVLLTVMDVAGGCCDAERIRADKRLRQQQAVIYLENHAAQDISTTITDTAQK